jgi:hypothetical protein
MQECQPFYDMCTAAGPDLAAFCNAQRAKYDPPMRMYFHNGTPSRVHLWDGQLRGIKVAPGFRRALLDCKRHHSMRGWGLMSEDDIVSCP